jgi:hypothetical protein
LCGSTVSHADRHEVLPSRRDNAVRTPVIGDGRIGPDLERPGRLAEIAGNRCDEQELSVLCLRLSEAAMVLVNTLRVQGVLAYRSERPR